MRTIWMSLRQHMVRTDDARALLREIFVTAADFAPTKPPEL